MENLLDEFCNLTMVEQERELDSTESNRYFEIYETLRNNNIEVPCN